MARNSINQRAIENHLKEIAKGYERAARRNPIRVPIQTDTAAEGVSMAGRDAIEGNPILARLLMWLEAETVHPQMLRRQPLTAPPDSRDYIDVTRFVEEEQLEGENPSVLAFELEQRDLVKILRGRDTTLWVRLSDAGRVAVSRLKKLQQDRAARLRYTMDAFLRWLFDTVGDQSPTDPSLFLATPSAYFAGAAISGTDLHQALALLAEPNLIERIDTDPATVAITPEGVSCALSGGSVQDHTNQARTGATYNNFLPNAKGVIIGEQQHFTQNNTDGVDPTLFVQLAGYVGQVSPTLGMPEPDRVELERVAQDLHEEATSETPEPGRLRQFATQLKDKLLEAGTTMAATMGVQMAEQALGALVQ